MWAHSQHFGLIVLCVFILPSSLHQQLFRASSRFCASKKMALIGQGCHYALRSNFIVKSLLQVTEWVLLPVGGTPPVVNEL